MGFHSKVLALSLALLATISGCTKKDDSETPTASKSKAKPAATREVNLSIWANYLTEEQQRTFTAKTGIKLNISNFSSNEELLAKMQSGGAGIDVAVPSDYMVEIMSKLALLEPLKLDQIPNAKEVSPDFLRQPYDPANQYSLPYAWSTTGIAFRRDLYQGQIKSWKELFANKEVAGKLSLLDDAREVLGAALKSAGYGINSTDKKELAAAKDVIVKARKGIKMFRSETVDALVNKEVAVAQAYSTDALQAAAKSGGKIEFVIPEDGGAWAIDNVVIPKGAKNVAEAHELINFLLSVENNVEFVKHILAGPVLTKTKDLLPEDVRKNVTLFPSTATLKKFERIHDLGDFTAEYEKAWTEIKSE